jgi:hypothetical protein
MLSPWMARAKAFKRQPPTFERTVFFYGFQAVGTACGGKPALGAKEWRYGSLVKPDYTYEQP